jgi:hypothetical protein
MTSHAPPRPIGLTRLGLAVLAVAGCNQAFGLDRTQPVDARYFDAPIDAPFACPPLGETPAFSPSFQQVVYDCREYSLSLDRQALALCGREPMLPFEGVIDGPLDRPAVGLADPTYALQFARLAPEGDELVATYYRAGTGYELRTYARQPNGDWSRKGTIATAPSYRDVSGPTRRPRHVMLTTSSNALAELVEDTPLWRQVALHPASELGVGYPGAPKLSADGLRLLLVDGTRVVYADRPTIEAPFRPAAPVDGLPYVTDAFLTDDCSRVYFSGVGTVFYSQRL